MPHDHRHPRFAGTACTAILLGSSSVFACGPTRAPASLTPSLQGTVNVLTAYDDGSGLGKAFFAGGSFSQIGGVARLTPSGWSAPGSVLGGSVMTLDVIEDGTGPGGRAGLYAGGSITGSLARWDGQAWQPISPAPSGPVHAVAGLPDASGQIVLHIVVGNVSSAQFQRLENGAWRTLGILGGSGRWTERVMTLDEDGPGPRPSAIFMGSGIAQVNDMVAIRSFGVQSGLVRWDGVEFTALPAAGSMGSWIKAMEVYDDGINGPSLFVAGHGTPPLGPILRWDTTMQTFVRPGPALTSSGDTAYGMCVLGDGVGVNAEHTRMYGVGGTSGLGLTNPNTNAAALNGAVWNPVTFAQNAGSFAALNYHLPSAAGELGAGRVPALLYVTNFGTTFAAIVGCPRCAADLDLDGAASVGDIFAYIAAYFARTTTADFDGSGQITLQDLFDYLAAYFVGCA